jgi:predicted nucleic acid-binding protein
MRQGERVFVDSGAWIALALARDPLHPEAREQWDLLYGVGGIRKLTNEEFGIWPHLC